MGKYTKDWEEMKPEKPKRPVHPFACFIQNYCALEKHKSKGPDLFKKAASAWKNLDRQEKEYYKDYKEEASYKKLMMRYKRTMSAMKRPAQTYGLFVKRFWQQRRPNQYHGTRQQFGEIQKEISRQWNQLSDEEQGIYRAGGKMLQAMFETEQFTVLSGARPLNVNWQHVGIKKICETLDKVPTADEDVDDNDEADMGFDEEQNESTAGQDQEAENDEDYDDFDDETFDDE